MALPVLPEARDLAEEVKAAGDYGSLTNTILVSLRNELARLKAEAAAKKSTGAAMSATQQPPQSSGS